jgi:hypothetical protein
MKLLLACSLCVLATPAFSFENEPDSFRGIKWGTDVKDVPKLVKVEDSGSFKAYKKSQDKLKIGEADVKNVFYGFYDNQFAMVLIEYFGSSSFSLLKETLFQLYGTGLRPNRFMENYMWHGKIVDISMEYSEITKKGSIIYSYKPIGDKNLKDRKEKAKKGAKDL